MRMINADSKSEPLGDVICESCGKGNPMSNCLYILYMKNLKKIFICSRCFQSEAPQEFADKLQLDNSTK